MQSILRFVSGQIQLLVTHARFTMSLQCHVTTTTSESAALSSLSPPVSPHPTYAPVFDVRTWHRSHQSAKFSPPQVCVTPKHDVRLSLFFVTRTRCPGTKALYPRCYHQGQYHTTFCASTSRWTHHKHRTPSSKATVTSMWPPYVLRVVVVLLWALPTQRAAVCSAQPHSKCGEGWPLPLRQAKR